MATSKIMSDKFTSETLVPGATLMRYGNMRILRLGGWTPNNGAIIIPESDRPSAAVSGTGVRSNSNAFLCFAIVNVLTSGSVQVYVGASYNTQSGWVSAGAEDAFEVNVIWWL